MKFQVEVRVKQFIKTNGNFNGTSTEWLFEFCFQVEFEFRNVVFCVLREKNRSTRRKTLRAGTRTNNKLSPVSTQSLPGIELGPH